MRRPELHKNMEKGCKKKKQNLIYMVLGAQKKVQQTKEKKTISVTRPSTLITLHQTASIFFQSVGLLSF